MVWNRRATKKGGAVNPTTVVLGQRPERLVVFGRRDIADG
jgi:hypothetical protein